MLEALILFFLSRSIVEKCKSKGREATGYVIWMIFGWIGAGIVGVFIGAIIAEAAGADGRGEWLFLIGGYIAGAGLHSFILFVIVDNLSSLRRLRKTPKRKRDFDEEDYDDDEDDSRSSRSSRRSRDYDDEDDRPRRRRDYDDEEDDSPRRRRRHRDDD